MNEATKKSFYITPKKILSDVFITWEHAPRMNLKLIVNIIDMIAKFALYLVTKCYFHRTRMLPTSHVTVF